MFMSLVVGLDFNEEDYLEEGGVVRVEDDTSGDDVKYEWQAGIDGGRPPYDAVVKDDSGVILDSKWNVTSETIKGEFYGSPNMESIIVEIVDESNQYVSKTFNV